MWQYSTTISTTPHTQLWHAQNQPKCRRLHNPALGWISVGNLKPLYMYINTSHHHSSPLIHAMHFRAFTSHRQHFITRPPRYNCNLDWINYNVKTSLSYVIIQPFQDLVLQQKQHKSIKKPKHIVTYLTYILNVAPFTFQAINEVVAFACAFSDSVVGCVVVVVSYLPWLGQPCAILAGVGSCAALGSFSLWLWDFGPDQHVFQRR